MSFVHLHVHTHYSLLDGFSRIKDLVNRTKELGMPAVAITDHGTMFGVIEFYRAAKAAGVKPLIGLEAYLAARGMSDRDPQFDKRSSHLLLLAENNAGYQNLLKIASAAQLEGFYYYPRIDKDFLINHSEGLIVTSACLRGEIPAKILERGNEEAQKALDWYFEVFGPDHYFLELQRHDLDELEKVNSQLVELGKRYNARFIATNDVHYVNQTDAKLQDIQLAIGTGTVLADPNRMRMNGDSYYLKSPQEMSALFSELPVSIFNTMEIAERCNVNLDPTGYHLPIFEVPDGHTPQTYLRELCLSGMQRRYGDQAKNLEVLQRVEHELGIIHGMGFNEYFLIVWDLCRYAREHDIWYEARGSAAGSIVGYVLGITLVEPIQHGLLFERFLNPDRINMPDIDLDFQDDKRAEIMEYCAQKFGHDHVSQIITFGTLGARGAIRDVGRVMDIPLNEVERITKLIPNIPGRPTSIRDALEQVQDLKDLYEREPYLHDLIDAAAKMEGVARSAGLHAAGVVISDKPLTEYVPIHRPTGNSDDVPIKIVTQYEMSIIDHLGLLKVDFLGLATLTTMQRASDLIHKRHGIKYTLGNIPVDDPQTFEFLNRGLTAGVFQLEGAGMTRFLLQMKPTKLDHIIAMVALYRPGPMDIISQYINRMHHLEPITYRHPKLEPILSETYGFAIYQEQVMQAAMQLGGYTAAEADSLRSVISKKKAKELEKYHKKFVEGAVLNGIDRQTADLIFSDWEGFAHYGFNKSHAADYGTIAVQTAFLKAHYPLEYMTALLSQSKNDSEKVALYVADCRAMGIEVLPPNVNFSEWDFTIEEETHSKNAIRFGLGAIRNVGQNPVELITEARHGQPFKDINDFARLVDLRKLGKRALEPMVRVGALDCFGDRRSLLESIDQICAISESHFKAKDTGQLTFFGGVEGLNEEIHLSSLIFLDRREKLEWERELLGLYLSEHPLSAYMTVIRQRISHFSGQLGEAPHLGKVVVAGIINTCRTHITKTGKEMAFATMEDFQGLIELTVFPPTWQKYQHLLESDQVLLITGKVENLEKMDNEKKNFKILVDQVEVLNMDQKGDINYEAGINFSDDNWSESDFESIMMNDSNQEEEEPGNALVNSPKESNHNPGDTTSSFSIGTNHQHASLTSGLFQPVGVSDSPLSEIRVEYPIALADQLITEVTYVNETEKSKTTGSGHILVVRLISSGSKDRDIRKLRQIYGLLTSIPGSDRIAFICQENEKSYRLDFPNDRTCISASLTRELSGIVGETNITIEDGG